MLYSSRMITPLPPKTPAPRALRAGQEPAYLHAAHAGTLAVAGLARGANPTLPCCHNRLGPQIGSMICGLPLRIPQNLGKGYGYHGISGYPFAIALRASMRVGKLHDSTFIAGGQAKPMMRSKARSDEIVQAVAERVAGLEEPGPLEADGYSFARTCASNTAPRASGSECSMRSR
jgi:hypothetical protein